MLFTLELVAATDRHFDASNAPFAARPGHPIDPAPRHGSHIAESPIAALDWPWASRSVRTRTPRSRCPRAAERPARGARSGLRAGTKQPSRERLRRVARWAARPCSGSCADNSALWPAQPLENGRAQPPSCTSPVAGTSVSGPTPCGPNRSLNRSPAGRQIGSLLAMGGCRPPRRGPARFCLWRAARPCATLSAVGGCRHMCSDVEPAGRRDHAPPAAREAGSAPHFC